MPSLDPSAAAHATCYLCLVKILRFESLLEPRYDADCLVEWLAWVHTTRWMIVRSESRWVPSLLFAADHCLQRAMYESHTRALLLGVDSLHALRPFSEIDGLIQYLDKAFFCDSRQANMYPTIAISAERIQAEQGNGFEELMLTHPHYYSAPMVLSDYHNVAGNFEDLGCNIRDLVTGQQSMIGIIVGVLGNGADRICSV